MVPNVATLHEEVAHLALKAGRHVLLEKPISVCIASGERILQAQPPDKVLMVAENAQYWREIVETQRLIQSGLLGSLLSAKCWESAHPALNEWAADGSYDAGSFIADAAEGFVFDSGLHWLRPLRMFLGKAGPRRACGCSGWQEPPTDAGPQHGFGLDLLRVWRDRSLRGYLGARRVYFTKDEASIREDQAKAEAERARKAKQERLQEEERKKREEIERKIREEAEKKRADEIASKKQARMV
eukprot:Skav233849  [mRNA]  locus=scaffold3130:177908:184849:- [translate_table: standard]